MSKKTIYHRGYVIEWIEHMNSWRIYREESKANTIAYQEPRDSLTAGPGVKTGWSIAGRSQNTG